MQFTFRHRDPNGAVFARTAFDGQIGKEITVNDVDGTPKRGKLVAAEVIENGTWVLLTIEADVQITAEP